ncbi:MAG: hypothetical protein ABL885_15335 [Methylophilaceae bacterium]
MNDKQADKDEDKNRSIAKSIIAGLDELYTSGELQRRIPTPVDNIINEILDSFASKEECNIVSWDSKNADIIKYFETNPELLALVRTVDNCDLVCWSSEGHVSHFFLPIHGGATYSEVAEIIAALFRVAEQKASDQNTAPPDTIKALCANFPDNLPGGMALQAEGRIWKGPNLSNPSFFQESLSAWQQFYDTGYLPGQGEGCDPLVTKQEDECHVSASGFFYRIGEDSDQSVFFNRNQLKIALENVRQDIKDFLVPLRSWALRYYPEEAEELVACFTKAFVGCNGS